MEFNLMWLSVTQITRKLFVLLLIFFVAGAVSASIRNVPSSSYPTIQAAINAASAGDTILVADGTYSGTGNRDIDMLGKQLVVLSVTGFPTTVIDCAGTSSDPHRGFYIHTGEQSQTLISGFTIKNGFAVNGAGIYCTAASGPVIENCLFSTNSCQGLTNEGEGAGLYCSNASVELNNCVFESNWAANGGAGLACREATATLTNCEFTNNTAPKGGGVFAYQSSITTETCSFLGNAAFNDGGAFYSELQSAVVIRNSSFFANQSASGGAFYCFGLISCEITNCIFSTNYASTSGGGLWIDYSNNVLFTNCLIVSNRAIQMEGGGLLSFGSAITMSNCTFTANSSGFSGGAMSVPDSSPLISNSIFWNNFPSEIFGSPVVTYSDVQMPSDTYPGLGNINADPLFVTGPSASYILKQEPDGASPYSPCVNAGSALAANVWLPDGTASMNYYTTRTDNQVDTGIVDMGFHHPLPSSPVPSVSTQGIVVLLVGFGLLIKGNRRTRW